MSSDSSPLLSTLNCASLLISLIVSGLADEELFEDIYFTCIDMLAVIIHHLAGGDVGLIEPSETRSGSRRDKLHIEKKIKKEIGESDHPQIMGLRQLIPLPRDSLDIVKYEKAPVDKDKSWRTGSLKPVGKEKVSTWDLIEGLKSTFPISLSWFGASRASRLPPHWQYRVRMVWIYGLRTIFLTNLFKQGECPARSPMEKWLELSDLPPDDVQEPAKKEAKTENNILPPVSGGFSSIYVFHLWNERLWIYIFLSSQSTQQNEGSEWALLIQTCRMPPSRRARRRSTLHSTRKWTTKRWTSKTCKTTWWGEHPWIQCSQWFRLRKCSEIDSLNWLELKYINFFVNIEIIWK